MKVRTQRGGKVTLNIWSNPSRRASTTKLLPFVEIGAFIAEKLRDNTSISAKALEFTILAATRTNETLGARWDGIDLDAGVWSVRRAHKVAQATPRSYRRKDGGDLARATPQWSVRVRPVRQASPTWRCWNCCGGPLAMASPSTASARHSEIGRQATGYANHVVEMALAHALKDKTEAAYRRGDLLAKRVRLMTTSGGAL